MYTLSIGTASNICNKFIKYLRSVILIALVYLQQVQLARLPPSTAPKLTLTLQTSPGRAYRQLEFKEQVTCQCTVLWDLPWLSPEQNYELPDGKEIQRVVWEPQPFVRTVQKEEMIEQAEFEKAEKKRKLKQEKERKKAEKAAKKAQRLKKKEQKRLAEQAKKKQEQKLAEQAKKAQDDKKDGTSTEVKEDGSVPPAPDAANEEQADKKGKQEQKEGDDSQDGDSQDKEDEGGEEGQQKDEEADDEGEKGQEGQDEKDEGDQNAQNNQEDDQQGIKGAQQTEGVNKKGNQPSPLISTIFPTSLLGVPKKPLSIAKSIEMVINTKIPHHQPYHLPANLPFDTGLRTMKAQLQQKIPTGATLGSRLYNLNGQFNQLKFQGEYLQDKYSMPHWMAPKGIYLGVSSYLNRALVEGADKVKRIWALFPPVPQPYIYMQNVPIDLVEGKNEAYRLQFEYVGNGGCQQVEANKDDKTDLRCTISVKICNIVPQFLVKYRVKGGTDVSKYMSKQFKVDFRVNWTRSIQIVLTGSKGDSQDQKKSSHGVLPLMSLGITNVNIRKWVWRSQE